MLQRFYQHILKEKNLFYLNRKTVLQPNVSEKITDFLKEADENYKDSRNNLRGKISILKAISTLPLKLTKTRKI